MLRRQKIANKNQIKIIVFNLTLTWSTYTSTNTYCMHDSTFKSCSTKALEMHVLQLASWRWCKAVKTEDAHWQMRTDLIQKPCSHTWGAAYLRVWLISQYLQWFSFFKGSNTTTGPNSHIAIWQLMPPITTPPVCQWCSAIPKYWNIDSREFKRQHWQQQWCHKWITIHWMRKNNRAASVAIFFLMIIVTHVSDK